MPEGCGPGENCGPCYYGCTSCNGCSGCSSCSGCSGCSSCSGCSGCSGSCSGACNVGCKNGNMATIYERLKSQGLKEFIEASNVQDISTLATYEVQRRNRSGYSDTITKELMIIADYFNHIKSNLTSCGQTLTYTNTKNEAVLRKMGEELVAKVLKSYETLVGRP